MDPYSIALGAAVVYAVLLHMALVYLATALKVSSDTLSATEKDLSE